MSAREVNGAMGGFSKKRQAEETLDVPEAPAKPLTIVVVLPTSPRRLKLQEATSGRLSPKGLFAGGVPVVQTGAARSGFGGARLLRHPGSSAEAIWVEL